MAIEKILVNVEDIARAASFYRDFLRAEPIGEPTADRALLDVVTAVIELRRVCGPVDSTWIANDRQRGFRHIGFRVAAINPLIEKIKAAGVPFNLDPLEVDGGGVRITLFFDPDGTQLEFVERELQYSSIVDEELVRNERALGAPDRPRFDHIAVTVDDFDATMHHYEAFGFAHLGTLLQPHDRRGFQLDFLKSGDTVLEIFTFEVEKYAREPQLGERGYVAARLTGTSSSDRVLGPLDEGTAYVDVNDFTYALVP